MTNKTEDRFYFGKPGHPERFSDSEMRMHPAEYKSTLNELKKQLNLFPLTGNRRLDAFIEPTRRAFLTAIELMQRGKMTRMESNDRIVERRIDLGYKEVEALLKDIKNTYKPRELNHVLNLLYDEFQNFDGPKRAEMVRVFNLGVNVRNAYEKVNIFGGRFSRPGQPERFEESSQASIGQTVLNKIEAALAAGKTVYLSNMMKSTVITPKNYAKWKASGTPLFKVDSKGDLRIYQGGKYVVLTSGAISHVRVDAHSRPGQPERFDMEGACWEGYEPVGTKQKDGKTVPNCVPMKNAEEDADTFDASSLERGAFAEASKSPMLGKLLAAKAMPDGGWRAVQVGSDTLVISFEDADLARDFGRRVASKGYSATSPVATTGRYWNVEVKNG